MNGRREDAVQLLKAEAGMGQCLACHGPEGLKPVPADHAGRTEDISQVCHKPKTDDHQSASAVADQRH